MPTDAQRVQIVGRVITMMRLADDLQLERKGSQLGGLTRFVVTIDVDPHKLAAAGREPHDYYGTTNKLSDVVAAERAMKRSDQLIGREAYKTGGVAAPPLSKDERDALHEELKMEGIIERAPVLKRKRKKKAADVDRCDTCNEPLEGGVCKSCVADMLERDDEGLFDVG